jgi:uncharacterized RDD family membrane protein YckC
MGLLDAGSISRRTLVWRQGLPQWQALEQLANELGLPAVSTPPAPPLPPAPPRAAPMASEPAATRVLSLDALEPAANRATEATQNSRDGVDAAYAASVTADPQAATYLIRDGHVVYAGFLKRVAASFIDGVIVSVVGGVIGGMVGAVFGFALMGGDFGSSAGSNLLNLISSTMGLVLGLLYYGGFHSSESQATPGKMLIGIKVARVDGDRLTPVRAGARFLATYINLFTLGIGWLMAAFTERKQALHDFIADTVVVDRWAFTEFPERQNSELGGCAIAILIAAALLVVAMIAMVGVFLAALSSGGWR